jgi:hypothetical protein
MPASQSPSLPPTRPPPSSSLLIFGLLGVLAVAGIFAYALYSRAKIHRQESVESPVLVNDPSQLAEIRRKPHLLFRNTALGPMYGRLSVVPLTSPDGARYPSELAGDRVYGTAKSGFYLRASRRALTTYEAVSFNGNFEILHHFKLTGAPSRTRVSPDGALAAATVFVSGDSYNTGGFSTRTTLFDLTSGTTLGELEDFAVWKDGQLFKKPDFNFWGVTFAANKDRFYATLASSDIPYLVEGSISRRELRVLHEGVECPSLSPDGSRVVFKSRSSENGRRVWRLHVLNLKTQQEVIVGESRSVDDQAEWLDSEQVLYALPRDLGAGGQSDIWLARADGSGTPTLFVHNGSSPCVILP